jgi:hypothetical protein
MSKSCSAFLLEILGRKTGLANSDDHAMIVTQSEAKGPRAKRKGDGSPDMRVEPLERWDAAAKLRSASRGDSSTSSE